MKGMEGQLQKSFQAVCDEGVSSDHSFKFAKMIKAGVQSGKMFKATHVAVSKKGFVNFNRLAHTKSNSEIEPVVERYAEVRENAGEPKLLRYEGDGGKDRNVWLKKFPELQDGVKPYEPPTVNGLVRATINDTDYTVLTTNREANNWALALLPSVVGYDAPKVHIGLDAESNQDETQSLTRTLQIAFPKNIYDKVVVVHLSKMNAFTSDTFPERLRKLLQLRKIVLCGAQISHDAKRLLKLGVRIYESRDLIAMAKVIDPGSRNGCGVTSLSAQRLSIGVDKRLLRMNPDWSQDLTADGLAKHLAQHTALDARISLQLAFKLLAAHDNPRL